MKLQQTNKLIIRNHLRQLIFVRLFLALLYLRDLHRGASLMRRLPCPSHALQNNVAAPPPPPPAPPTSHSTDKYAPFQHSHAPSLPFLTLLSPDTFSVRACVAPRFRRAVPLGGTKGVLSMGIETGHPRCWVYLLSSVDGIDRGNNTCSTSDISTLNGTLFEDIDRHVFDYTSKHNAISYVHCVIN